MNFFETLMRVMLARPWKAAGPIYWYATGRRLRARNRLRAIAAQLPFAYKLWIADIEKPADSALAAAIGVSATDGNATFSIVLDVQESDSIDDVSRTISSLRSQGRAVSSIFAILRQDGSLGAVCDALLNQGIATVQASDRCGLDKAISSVPGEYLLPVQAGDLLAPLALVRLSEAIEKFSTPAVLYWDQDSLDSRGERYKPWFKPEWNEEMFFAQDYLSAAVAVRRDLAASSAIRPDSVGAASIHDLLLQVTDGLAPSQIVHLPYVLTHRGRRADERFVGDRVAAVNRRVSRYGAQAAPGPYDTVRTTWPLPEKRPLVTIIVPTRDKVELLEPCINSLLRRTEYLPFEVLIVDNGSSDQAALAFLDRVSSERDVRVEKFGGAFNFSAINNFAAHLANGEFLCLLNNDTEVIEAGWLTEMMRYAVRPHIGAVGAKLLYDDRTIQHAGVVVGICEAAGHAHRFTPNDQPGYFYRPHIAHYVSAVTAACLIVEKSKFEAVGGFDELRFAVAYNDVDLCLRLQEAGYRNVYVPHAVLLHHESKSRGDDMAPEHLERYTAERDALQERWGTVDYQDPLHSPNLDRRSETYIIGI